MGMYAKIIADTMGNADARVTTFEVSCPRFILAEINTHRVIAKSAASSRAIPVRTRINMVRDDPFIPNAFGKNRPGMQASEDLTDQQAELARVAWLDSMTEAIKYAELFADLEVHKQTANRILEPYSYVTVCLTATEWENFFWLRTSPDAQPEFRDLAVEMQTLYNTSRPVVGIDHLPYCDAILDKYPVVDLRRISSARCARTSYKTFDGKTSTPEEDINLYTKLTESGHLSPFDHVATTDRIYFDNYRNGWFWVRPDDHRHLYGWKPFRVEVERSNGLTCKRNSYGKIKGNLIQPDTLTG